MAVTLRGTGIQASSASSYTVNWPSGTVAGDRAVVTCGHGFAINLPSGWTALDNSTGGNWNGRSFWKDLSSGDISTGHVTVTTTGGFDGTIAITTVQTGTFDTTIAPLIVPIQNSSGSSTVTVNGLVPTTSDYAIYFGSNRAASTNTCSIGSLQQQSNDGSAASGCLYTENPGSVTPSPVFSYSTAGSGNYQCVVAVMAPLTIPSWIRGSGVQASSASSYTVSWPYAVSGDTAVIMVGGGFVATVPSGWTGIDNSTGANWQGSVFYRVLNSTDISTGNVSVAMSGTFDSFIGIAVVKSASLSGYANPVATMGQNSGHAATRTVNYTSSHTTDFALSFSSFRVAASATIVDVTGSTIQNQTNDQSAASGCLYAGSPNSVGTISPVFRFGNGATAGNGDYEGTVLFAGPTTVNATVNLVGVAATAAAGTLSPATSATVALTGVSATAHAGTFSPTVSVTLSLVGVSATALAGTIFPVTNFLTVPITTIMNANPIPATGAMVADPVPNTGALPHQLPLECILNINPIPMTGTMISVPVPGEGSVP